MTFGLSAAQEPFIGEVRIFAGNFAPRGWAFCEGQVLPISQNQALFSLIGTIYGGDGRTTFALPDLRGRVPLGKGNGPGLSNYPLGVRGGSESTVLKSSNLPSHNHGLGASTERATERTPAEDLVLCTGRRRKTKIYCSAAADIFMSQSSVGTTGSNTPFDIRQPYLAMNYIIALQGIFPSRT